MGLTANIGVHCAAMIWVGFEKWIVLVWRANGVGCFGLASRIGMNCGEL